MGSGETMKAISEMYLMLKQYLEADPEWKAEIDHVRKVLTEGLDAITPWFFYRQYAFVVLCTYWKEQYARREWDCYFEDKPGDQSCISNPRKRLAIWTMRLNYDERLEELRQAPDKLAYLQTLSMIGEVTCRHLARNIGIDCVKPDRHMNRIAWAWGYGHGKKVPQQIEITTRMCDDVRKDTGEPFLGVVDVIFWRAANLGWI
jgi:hypothetical protein